MEQAWSNRMIVKELHNQDIIKVTVIWLYKVKLTLLAGLK